ncbi:MAG: hypothetical protein FDX18_05460 [Chlorobium sp.]|nr:MAG: hypothetical protein FDX18_05460 [Chlorobium sp.]
MKTPFDWLEKNEQKQVAGIFWIFLILVTLLFGFVFNPLVTEAAPWGVISFELPPIGESGGTIASLQSWNAAGQLIPLAKRSLELDFLYIVLYAVPLSISSLLAARTLLDKGSCALGKAGIIMSWVVMVAAISDGLENYFLLSVIAGFDPLVPTAMACMAKLANLFAIMKFVLLLSVVLYLLLAFLEKIVLLLCGPAERSCLQKSASGNKPAVR